MDRQIVALMFQEGGKFITEIIRNYGFKRTRTVQPVIVEKQPAKLDEPITEEGKASSVEAGCVPCAIGHFGTCTGLLNEAMRFAKKDGVGSSEVIDRVNMCLDELNAMERVDLRPEMITDLPEWEKELANRALTASRATRHGLEGLTDGNDLEKVAASTQTARTEIGRGWFQERMARMPKEEKEKLAEKAIEKLEEV
ncbi:hypothetical protein LCGC14_1168210 [marine sediment metagenome]|uniref:Uncharacterized protein n=1 Tax=marine sediment metagenome TaxID=412755 RepID=A0A0F9PW35_9ZZZZ